MATHNREGPVLVLGCTGMLGNALMRYLAQSDGIEAWGTARELPGQFREQPFRDRVIVGVDVENTDSLVRAFATARPRTVINCVGLVKQLAEPTIRCARFRSTPCCRIAWQSASAIAARLVHISTDCVFSGTQGQLPRELTLPMPRTSTAAASFSARSTIRTRSPCAPRSSATNSRRARPGRLVPAQTGRRARAITRAIFSGLPTVELARVIRDYVIPRAATCTASTMSRPQPISKYDLLRLVARTYGKTDRDRARRCASSSTARSTSSRFRAATGYAPPPGRRSCGACTTSAEHTITTTRHVQRQDPADHRRHRLVRQCRARSASCTPTSREIRIFSRDEKKQEDMRIALRSDKLKFYIGDVRDYDSVHDAMQRRRLRLPRGGAEAGAVVRVLSDGGGAHQRARRRERAARGDRARRQARASC